MPGMVPEDVYELTGVADPRLSPDGKRVAFVVWRADRESNDYRSSVWTAQVEGRAELRRVTFGPKRDADPRWSPDGSQLAFVSKRGEGEDAAQLFVLPFDGGEARRLTELKEDVGEVAWSPDGQRIAFVARVRAPEYDESDNKKRPPRRIRRLQYKLDNEGWTIDRPHHLFVVAADGSEEPRQITFGDHEDHHPAWSPDGSRIAFSSARHADWDLDVKRDLYVVDAGPGDVPSEPERLTTTDGACDGPSWSPDGSRIAYRYYPGHFNDPRHVQVAVLDMASGRRRLLTEPLDRNCGPYPDLREPIWEGPDVVLFSLEDRGNTHLSRVRADGTGQPKAVVDGDVWVTGYDAAGGEMVHSATTHATFSELFVGDRRLTDVGASFMAGREIVPAERFTAVSPDGSEVDAWIVRPVAFEEGKNYPLLLYVHGGPFTQLGNRFFDEFQVYANAGYAVAFSNPRGSSGYSEAWGRAIRGPVAEGPGWGTVDYEDLMAVVDEAIKRFDFVDPDRLGVMGGSYGGFMTSWIVGHTDRFQAAISERSVNQWVSMWGASDYGWDFKGSIGSFLFEDFDAYVKVSPTTYATDITTPLLIMHSENDLRCPVEQAEQLFVTLRLLKRDVEMVRFPEEGHELTRSGSPVHRVMRFGIILDWLGRHLQG
jgi:dipeptidyl aminopeptidase/acylaminoacyl peptidase